MNSFIGIGVTIQKRGCSEAYTVIRETKSKKTLTIQRDKVKMVKKPHYEHLKKSKSKFLINQKDIMYEYERDSNGSIVDIKYLKGGYWKIVNQSDIEFNIIVGERKELNYQDL